jgi:pantoate--beta-alanine ligase
MKIVKTVREMQQLSDKLRENKTKIACVPTMGYFHDGHVSLMKRGKELADVVVTTLFVNPTQFAPNEDFEDYPRDFERDANLAEAAGVDILFNPSVKEMYPDGYNTFVQIKGVTDKFEGQRRPTHFNGVATVVSKLFNAVKPHIAIFGQKDYQQTLVIKQLTKDLLFDIKIHVAPTQRQSDGLAMSSRNVYLSTEQRSKASAIYEALQQGITAIESGEKRRKIINATMQNVLRQVQAFQIDYCSAANAEDFDEPEEFLPGQKIVLLIAAYMGKTRLIDNAVCTSPSGISPNPEKFIEDHI